MVRPTDTSRPSGFWLVPSRATHSSLQQTIDALAREFDAPPFEPHVTLYVGEQGPEDDIETLLASVAASMGPITLIARATGHSDTLFKTLFIEFEGDEQPHDLSRAIGAGLARKVDYTLQPHLSLMYKMLPEAVRRDLAARYDFRRQRIVFDELAAVRPAGDGRDWMDIRGWEVFARVPLSK